MNEWSDEDKNRIIGQFEKYCFNLLRNQSYKIKKRNAIAYRAISRIDDLSPDELLNLTIHIPITPKTTLMFGEESISIFDEDLAEGLRQLTDRRLEVIVHYYFHDLNEREIGALLQCSHQAVHKIKDKSISELRRFMENQDE